MENPILHFYKTPVGGGWIDYEVRCGDCKAFGLVRERGGGPEMQAINEKAIERWKQKHSKK